MFNLFKLIILLSWVQLLDTTQRRQAIIDSSSLVNLGLRTKRLWFQTGSSADA